MTDATPLTDDVTSWKAAYLSLLDSWTALCDLAGVEGDSAPDEVLAALDAARSEAAAPVGLPEALRSFGERLAADGYGWEAIITREGPSGEETVAHLTTANPDPAALAASPAEPDAGGLDVNAVMKALSKALYAAVSLGVAERFAAEYARLRESEAMTPRTEA